MSSFFSGPEYTYDQRWVGRAANLILMILFFPLAYGLGYAIGSTIGDSIAPAALCSASIRLAISRQDTRRWS